MAFYNFKNLSLSLNGNQLIPSEIQLESEVEIMHPLKVEERTTERNVPATPYQSALKIRYFLTGQDYLKPYLYALENQTLTGNFCGLTFNQSYISDYSVSFGPNSPVEITANIQIYDKISGNFTPSSPISQTGIILRTSDIKIDNLSNYTSSLISNIIQASYNYNCKLNPSYSYDSGIPLTRADRVSIEDRKWDIEIISDSTNLNIPLSGDKFALTISGANPYNRQINESFSASGVIYSKQLNISSNKVHSHVIKLSQNHANNVGGISGISINSNTFNIYSTPNTHPFTNSFLSSIDKIVVADTICPSFNVSQSGNTEVITVNTPINIINGPLSIYTSKGNFFWPNILTFTYPNITITGISQRTGYPGTPVYISGTNFYRVGQVNYGGIQSSFQIISSGLILSIVPNGAITNKVQLVSNLRNKTGYTNDYFYCQPSISLLTPISGIWGDSLVVGGLNFSGTTGVKFGPNMINASSFVITSNNILSIQSPPTGAGYSEGYVTVLTSGGSTQSISRYVPQVPLYSFSGLSGIYFDNIFLSLTVDSGYLAPTGGGYKIRVGGIDTIFYQNGTGLSGKVPFGSQSDYIYIYKPDGVSTYTLNPNQFVVHSMPKIFSITPSVVNQYQYINPVLIGQNFEFFTSELPWFFAISGGLNKDMQTGKNMVANSGGNADTIYIPNFIVTGQTGYYDIIVKNFAGSGIFKSGLLVNTGINQATSCSASITVGHQLGNNYAGLGIDGSTGTFAGMKCTAIVSGVSFSASAKNNNVMKISLIRLFISTGDARDSNSVRDIGQIYTANTSGALSLWFKNASKPFFASPIVDFSIPQNTIFNLFNSGITGVATVKVHTPAILNPSTNFQYFGVSELQIY